MIDRNLQATLRESLRKRDKVIVLHGPRRVGKTTLLRWLEPRMEGHVITLNGDFLDDQRLLRPERAALAKLTRGVDYLFIDEAQNIEHIGTSLKLLHDEHPAVRVLATGSSTFELTTQTGEPLTGRRTRHVLYPLSYAELTPTRQTSSQVQDDAMIYGTYPETINLPTHEDKADYLRQLASDYLLRDVFRQVDVNRNRLLAILRLLALQIGSEVSLSEIGQQVQMNAKTVARYLHFLEEAFVIFTLGGFSRNLRKEVGKSRKIYFTDLGVRNAILQSFGPLEDRSDVGGLFENLMIIERKKQLEYAGVHANHFFWRTYDKQEIDLVEEVDGRLRAFEFKLRSRRRTSFPKAWRDAYPDARNQFVDQESAHDFLQSASDEGPVA